jgi:hypothetical protein
MGVKGIETCHEIIWSKFLSLNVANRRVKKLAKIEIHEAKGD